MKAENSTRIQFDSLSSNEALRPRRYGGLSGAV